MHAQTAVYIAPTPFRLFYQQKNLLTQFTQLLFCISFHKHTFSAFAQIVSRESSRNIQNIYNNEFTLLNLKMAFKI